MPNIGCIIYDIAKVIGSMVLVQAKSGVLVQGLGNRNNGVCHEPLRFNVEPKNPSGKRKSNLNDYTGEMDPCRCAGCLDLEVGGFQGCCQWN